MTLIYTTPHDSDRHARLDIPNFSDNQDLEAYLDLKYSIKDYFKWHDVPERHMLQFVEAKLKRTIILWQ